MSKKIRLLVADDHAIMREGLKQLFALAGDLQVVAEAENGAMVLERLQRGGIDLLLLDMNMPGISGADLVTHIRAHYPDQKVLVLSVHNEPQIAQHTLRAGATGYLCKMCSLPTLLDAVRRVAGGMRFIDPQIAERIALEVSGLKQQSHQHTLTEREFQILLLFARGASVTRIAETLSISHKTVSTHKSRLMEKMGFSSNAEIVRFAVSQRLID
ncbi:response regulator transcription factor [Pseudomonas sp. B21-056]|jgi:DNA-binding NarL/FixJ family response regulator|uniref:response regulator n=1 Tax=Pseudomonas sp. B21-056 TaxID=2895495 RepID=UPI00222E1669|nr:response regulator transcription factor [Pseudomonas sp. B21-056]UZE21524.1 response regulator transcription factor [Pseudomonas sp. B21-056]